MNSLGAFIRQKRDCLNLSQEDLAKLVGVKRQTISLWELGLMEPLGSNIASLQRALQCEPDEILKATAEILDSK